MARIFITGSSAGLGRLAARRLVSQHHQVVLHARAEGKTREALKGVPGAETVLVGDLSRLEEVERLAEDANAAGPFDAIIHNAAVHSVSGPEFLAVNTVAPYVLTCLIHKPRRLVYLSSISHLKGDPSPEKIRSGGGSMTYADSKLHVLLLTMAVARRWPDVLSNAVHPGWVPTRMGGADAPDDLEMGFETQAWLAVSDEPTARVSGRYFFHGKEAPYRHEVDSAALQDDFLDSCEQISGIRFPLGGG